MITKEFHEENKRVKGTQPYAIRELGKFLHTLRHEFNIKQIGPKRLSEQADEMLDLFKECGFEI